MNSPCNILMASVIVASLLGCSRSSQNDGGETFLRSSSAEFRTNDTVLLSLILQRRYEDGGFTVVAPTTTLSPLSLDNAHDLAKLTHYVKDTLKTSGATIDELLKNLIEKNKRPVKLQLKSSPRHGYVIDYDGTYEKYFEDEGGGWAQWYEENPKAHGWTRVSLPAYDERSGLVLVCKGTQAHWLAGSGFLILYKYSDGTLEVRGRVLLWIS